MLNHAGRVFLFDVDNTLLDNDRFAADLTERLDREFGEHQRKRYWSLYDERRDRLGYADYLGTLQTFRDGVEDPPELLLMSQFIIDYPFQERVYPGAHAALEHLQSFGTTVILTDGDIVFQPRKVQRSGLWDAVDGRVLVTRHKERRTGLIEERYPALRYVMIDDKPKLLSAMKQVLGELLTTVFVHQGHYADESDGKRFDCPPDVRIDRIGDLCELSAADFRTGTPTGIPNPDRASMREPTIPEQS
ncbi:MAG: HAD family hydrolase [Lysobacter sp.]|nr:HAD family hydrolase [Lysobacter sp.]MDQ3269585.1 HAD family hydrolase [Pseudomonadota bacterium]